MAVEFPSDARRPPSREEHYVLEDLDETDRMCFGALAYVFFPAALFKGRWDPFVRFHVRQGAGLILGWIAGYAWSRITFWNEMPEVGWVGYAATTILICYGIRNALALEWRPVPLVGRLLDRLPLPKKLAEPTTRLTPPPAS